MFEGTGLLTSFFIVLVIFLGLATVFASFYSIGPTQIGLVRKRFGKKLPGNNPVAFEGEAGYQAELLMPGVRFKFKPMFTVPSAPSQAGTTQLSATLPTFEHSSKKAERRACKDPFFLRVRLRPFTP